MTAAESTVAALASLDALRVALVASLPSGDPRAADVARLITEARESCVRAVTAAGLHPLVQLTGVTQ